MELSEDSWDILLQMQKENVADNKINTFGSEENNYVTSYMKDLSLVSTNIISSERESVVSQESEKEERELIGKRLLHGNKEFMYGAFKILAMESQLSGLSGMESFVRFMKSEDVRTLVRTCPMSYRSDEEEELQASLVTIVELHFPEGEVPGEDILRPWLNIVSKHEEMPRTSLAVQGYQRSGCLIGVAFIHAGMPNLKAINTVREKIPQDLSSEQFKFLKHYKLVVKRRKSIFTLIKEQCSVV